MYIAMNRFTVLVENAEAFEELWLNRDSFLKDVTGFLEFKCSKALRLMAPVCMRRIRFGRMRTIFGLGPAATLFGRRMQTQARR